MQTRRPYRPCSLEKSLPNPKILHSNGQVTNLLLVVNSFVGRRKKNEKQISIPAIPEERVERKHDNLGVVFRIRTAIISGNASLSGVLEWAQSSLSVT